MNKEHLTPESAPDAEPTIVDDSSELQSIVTAYEQPGLVPALNTANNNPAHDDLMSDSGQYTVPRRV